MKRQADFRAEAPCSTSTFSRREFLIAGALAPLGLAAPGSSPAGAKAVAGLKVNGLPWTVLGRTGLKITRISFGGILVTEAAVLERAIERGIRLIHTSPEYQNGRSLEAVGKVMKTRRDKVVLALKVRPERLDEYLKALNTDYVDILVPPLDTVASIENQSMPEAFERQKKAGKCGFLGFACHTDYVIRVLDRARELDCYDLALLGYHFPMLSDPAVIRKNGPEKMKMHNETIVRNSGSANYSQDFLDAVGRAGAAGMGILAMKGLPKPQTEELNDSNQALIGSLCTSMIRRWHAHSVLASMGSFQAVDKYCGILENRLGCIDIRLEESFWAGASGRYCGACGNCRAVCPGGVDIQSVLRHRMYAQDYGLAEYARTGYRALPPEIRAMACRDCGRCEKVCSRGLPVRAMLKDAENRLC